MKKELGHGGKFIFILFLFLVLLVGVVSASDVGYILKYESQADKKVLNVFRDLGLSHELIVDSDVNGYDLSNYKFLFIDDVRLRNTRDLPIYNYPSVVMNSFYGSEWGLTNDGISQLASDQPLGVKSSEGVKQVYTRATNDGKYIPYYYLDDANKVKSFKSKARTWAGDGNSFSNVGDVIAIAQKGTQLLNGKVSGGNICFFGIAKTEYWTEEAEEMFIDCVGSVGITCFEDEDCPNEEVGEEYCMSGDVYQDVEEFECENPGTIQSQCVDDVVPNLVKECLYGCENGECLPECSIDSDCPNDYYSNNYCLEKSVVRDLHDFSCLFESCNENIITEFVKECTDLCENGECVDITCYIDDDCDDSDDYTKDTCNNPGTPESYCSYEDITCLSKSDCGIDGFIGGKYCMNDDSYQDYQEFLCVNPATPLSSCTDSVEPRLIEECANACVNGECIDIECEDDADCDDSDLYTQDECHNPGTSQSYCTNTPMNCLTNNDCGTTGFIGGEFCLENDIFKDYQTAICENSATPESYCNVSVSPRFLIDCGDDYCDPWGNNFCEYGDVWRERTCYNEGCLLGSCFSDPNPEKELVEDCVYGCENGECLPECVFDNDCESDYYSENYCMNDDAYRDLHDFSCIIGSCSEEVIPELVEVCEYGCANGECIIGIHDVSLIDFLDSVGGIKLEHTDGTNIPGGEQLLCGENYKIKINVENEGDYPENVSFNGQINGLVFNHLSIENFAPTDNTIKTRTVNFNLSEGVYTITVEALIAVDDNPLNNFAQRQIEIICPECFIDNDCESDYYSENYCMNDDAYRDLHDFSCIIGSCSEEVIPELVEVCEYGCANGECLSECVIDEECGTDHYSENYCMNDDAYRDLHDFSCIIGSCSEDIIPKLIEECADICIEGECVFITCYDESECGEDGFIENKYCIDDDVYQDYQDFDCLNPGTPLSSCTFTIEPVLLEECADQCVDGECIEIECYNNSDCDDSDAYTYDKCNNPATPESYCSHTPVNCVINEDCGITGFIGSEFCSNGEVFKDYQTAVCENPATPLSFCNVFVDATLLIDCGDGYCEPWGDNFCEYGDVVHSRTCYDEGCSQGSCFNSPYTDTALVEECEYSCENGECLPECVFESDCGTDYYEDNYCMNDDVYHDLHDFGCIGGSCSEEVIPELVEECADVCVNGECFEITCILDSDCGTNGFTGNRYCLADNSYENFVSYDCMLAGTINSYCIDNTIPVLMEYCDFACVSGDCITCFSDLDCGIDGFIGDKYCIDDDVYQDYQDFECTSSGTPDSDCLSTVNPELIEECADVCVNGKCEEIECYDDADCDDSDLYTQDKCNNPGTTSSYCSHTPLNCVTNEDCGFTGFIDLEFCQSNDVFKNYQTAVCENPQTPLSYCNISVNAILLIDCGSDYCESWGDPYCKLDDVYRSRDCYEQGCLGIACFSNSLVEEELVKECEYDCENGVCVFECNIDSDCSDDYYNNVRCIGEDVYHDFHDFSCIIGNCDEEITTELKEECADQCVDGECIEIECYNNSDCDDSDAYTYDKCNNPATPESYCSHTPIECLENSDCGIDGFIGGKYCMNDDSYQDYQEFLCVNPATPLSSCTDSVEPRLIEECDEICVDGECIECLLDSGSICYSGKTRPLLDCGGGESCNPGYHWKNKDWGVSPFLLVDDLEAGSIVLFTEVSGAIDFGGVSGLGDTAYCKTGVGSEYKIPKFISVAQFTDDNDEVVEAPEGAGVESISPLHGPLGNATNAILSKTFLNGLIVPENAEKIYVSFPDSRYNDNKGSCCIDYEVYDPICEEII